VNKLWLWGGAGAAALVGGFLLLRGGSAPAASSSDNSGGLGSYYPPLVYGGGGGSVTSDGSGSSTDNSIAQLIAGNLAVAQEQSNMTKYTSDNEKAIALAQYGSQERIAANDNTTKLALELDRNKTDIQKALAGQLGGLASALGVKGGIVGTIGFNPSNNAIGVDLKGQAASR
jgi:hypothetical protein